MSEDAAEREARRLRAEVRNQARKLRALGQAQQIVEQILGRRWRRIIELEQALNGLLDAVNGPPELRDHAAADARKVLERDARDLDRVLDDLRSRSGRHGGET